SGELLKRVNALRREVWEATHMRTAPDSRLGGGGVAPGSERVYRYLIQDGQPRSAGEVASGRGLPARTAPAALRAPDPQALVSRSPTRPPRYVASPPELALEPLLARRREELAEIRLFARELQGTFSRAVSSDAVADLVEIVAGRDRVVRYFVHLMRSTRSSF